MMHKILHRYATGNMFLTLLVLQAIMFMVIVPFSVWKFSADTNSRMLTREIGFSPDEAYELLEEYGPKGRRHALINAVSVNLVDPIIYWLFLSIGILYFLKKTFPAEEKLQLLAIFPFLTAIMDLLSNAFLLWLLMAFPARHEIPASLAAAFGILKWGFLRLSILLFLGITLAFLIRRYWFFRK
jgi:hypothetical protein